MTPVQFIFGLLRQTSLPVDNIDGLERQAKTDYDTLLTKGEESKYKPVQLVAQHAEKWYVKVGLAFLFLFASKWLLEKITGAKKASSAETELDEDDEDLFLDDLDEEDEH